ncbi:MAG: GLPGLI family protein [Sphingobacteriia bacterium]|jgi:GLPGLI family protein
MKIWFTSLALMAISTISAQQKEGTILYERKQNMHKTLANEQMKAYIPEFRTSNHMLLFSDSISVYRLIPEVDAPDPFSGGGGGGVVINIGGGAGGDMYKNFAQQKGLQSTEIGGKNFLIVDTLKPQPWKLTEETKKILGYTCYKATRKTSAPRMTMRTMSIGGPNSGDTVKSNTQAPTPKEIEIVAWYTNDIVTPAGPENYGLLPGLILEIDVDNGTTVFKATEVKATLNKKELKEPTKGKPIGRAEFQKLQMDMLQQQGPGMFQMRRGNN